MVELLRHQSKLVEAPYRYKDLRFFFLVAGYASGKTSGIVYAILRTVSLLLGKKDAEGRNPKILVASKNLTFMKKTLTGMLEQTLRDTNSKYTYDKAHNIIKVGNVEILLIPDEDESTIYGFSTTCLKAGTKVMTLMGEKSIEDVSEKDYVLTRKGFKGVKHAWCKGERDCIEVNVEGAKIICTPDHRFIDSFNNEVEAQDLTKTTSLVKLNTSVEKSLRQTDIPLLQPAHLTAKTSNVVGRYAVYDIEVEDCHEFFANGVLVHNCAFVDELDELPTATAMNVVKAINDRCRQRVERFRSPFLVFTTSSQGLKGTYQTVMHFKGNSIGYMLIRARTRDNKYLSKDYVDNMYRIYNENEKACYLDGHFVSVDSGLVYPDYNPAVNDLEEDLWDTVEDGEMVYVAQDFNAGFNYASAFIVRYGAIIMVKNYKLSDIRKAPQVYRYDFPKAEILWIPDMTYKTHFSEFKKELRMFGIKIAYRKSNPLVHDRNFAVNKCFSAGRLFVCPICTDGKNALLTHQKDRRTGLPMKGGDGAPDHLSDCLGYAVHYLLSWNRGFKDLYDITLGYLASKRGSLEVVGNDN